MSEASSRAQMERRLIQRSLEDESFRQRLLEEPRAALEEEIGARLPAEIQVQVVQESAETIYLVLPSASPLEGEGGELSDQQLEAVAGGDLGWSWDVSVPSCAALGAAYYRFLVPRLVRFGQGQPGDRGASQGEKIPPAHARSSR